MRSEDRCACSLLAEHASSPISTGLADYKLIAACSFDFEHNYAANAENPDCSIGKIEHERTRESGDF
jgi:hypothetical protein